MSINNRLNMLKPKVNDGSMGYIYSDNDQMINIHGNDDVDDDDQKGHRSILTIFFFSTEKKNFKSATVHVCVCVSNKITSASDFIFAAVVVVVVQVYFIFSNIN